MTEAEWLRGTDPKPMLKRLPDSASERKVRLFAAACCRAVWDLFTDERSRAAVEVSERYADGQVTEKHLAAARRGAVKAAEVRARGSFWAAWWAGGNRYRRRARASPAERAAWAAYWATAEWAAQGAWNVCTTAADAAARRVAGAVKAAGVAQAALLRDVIGNPFRPTAFDPAWRTPTVGKLAQAIYDGRAFDCLPILADALEEASCADADLLRHLRAKGLHVRGCWPLDLILNKK
jgi:hypothetical protein